MGSPTGSAIGMTKSQISGTPRPNIDRIKIAGLRLAMSEFLQVPDVSIHISFMVVSPI
jgi:hypothetical protein